MVSDAAADILLGAPASAAVMQVVFTGDETSRDYNNCGIVNKTGSSSDFIGTLATWVLRYDTETGVKYSA